MIRQLSVLRPILRIGRAVGNLGKLFRFRLNLCSPRPFPLDDNAGSGRHRTIARAAEYAPENRRPGTRSSGDINCRFMSTFLNLSVTNRPAWILYRETFIAAALNIGGLRDDKKFGKLAFWHRASRNASSTGANGRKSCSMKFRKRPVILKPARTICSSGANRKPNF